MTIHRHGHLLVDMGNGVAVKLASGESHFLINVKMPAKDDWRAQDKIIEAAGKPTGGK